LLKALMVRAGYEVLEASTGQEALDLIKREPVGVVLLDLMMRGVTGFDIIDYLRAERPAMLRCVIVVTAASGKDLAHLPDQDVFRVLRKPFEIQELLSAIAECFAARPDQE
ncbi:MAG TPA: response regulator, partial [Thermoanaerobaculia bacterium]